MATAIRLTTARAEAQAIASYTAALATNAAQLATGTAQLQLAGAAGAAGTQARAALITQADQVAAHAGEVSEAAHRFAGFLADLADQHPNVLASIYESAGPSGITAAAMARYAADENDDRWQPQGAPLR